MKDREQLSTTLNERLLRVIDKTLDDPNLEDLDSSEIYEDIDNLVEKIINLVYGPEEEEEGIEELYPDMDLFTNEE